MATTVHSIDGVKLSNGKLASFWGTKRHPNN